LISGLRGIRLEICLLLAGATVLPVCVRAESDATRPAATKSSRPASKRALTKPGAGKTTRTPSARGRRRRKETFKYRLSRLKLQPERITEIQQALARAGYLNQEPTGKWDDPTRDAMRRYQEANGFPNSGLPEAKSLMKLGLGPHPLPEELDSTAQAAVPAAAPLTPSDSDSSTNAPALPQQ